MVATRADRYTQTGKTQDLYSDFLDSFITHPATNVLATVTNERAVTQALKNLVKTNLGDRPFELDVGTNVRASLFEPNDFIAADILKSNIIYAVKTFEKRANLISVDVTPLDTTLNVSITYSLINNPQPITVQLILERVR